MTDHPHLTQALAEHSLTLFLGADLPQPVTGLPSRADLARGLAQRHNVAQAASLPSLAQVAQRVSRAGNRFDFTDYLRRELDTAGKPVPAFYRNLAAFAKEHALPAIVATAYDDSLERALRDAGVPFDRIVRGSDVAFARPDRLALIKLYGDVQMPDTLVVTEDDHYGLWRDRDKEALLDEVRSLLKKQTVLFLGYNLSDPDFNLLWREVLDKMGRFARTAYAVWSGLPEGEVQMWRDRMIQVLDADPWGLVEEAMPTTSALALQLEMPVNINRVIAFPIQILAFRVKADFDEIWKCLAYTRDLTRSAYWAEQNRLWWSVKEHNHGPTTKSAQWILGINRPGANDIYDFNERQMLLLQGAEGWTIVEVQADIDEEHRADPDASRIFDDFSKSFIATFRRLNYEVVEQDVSPLEFKNQLKGIIAGTKAERKYHGIGKAWGVLVGVNHYDDSYIADLKVCVDDVTAIQQMLTGRYQAARLLTDATPEHLPTRANILGELSTVAQAASEDDLLLFYFSGHGTAEGGESYLLAWDTRLAALKHTAVAMKDVREIIEQSPAHAKVIVLDACHSGASIGKAAATMTPEFIQRVFEEAEGMAVLASCKQGQQSWEWQAEHRSVFTYYLLDALSGKADLDGKGFVTVSDASRHVTDGVKAWAVDRGAPQTPTLQYTVAGDIILLRY